MLSSVFATPSSWAEDFLKSMLLEDMISDTFKDSNKFQQAITREEFAELVVMMYAKAKKLDVDSINAWNPFADTNSEMVAKAYNIGIVSGTGTDKQNRLLFSPKKNVTRQEIAVMLVKMLKQLDINTSASRTLTFTDSNRVASWALDSVRFVTEAGILSGIGNNHIGPLSNATREQSLVLINKLGIKYAWIRNELKIEKFNASNSTTYLTFRLPNYDASQLRAVQSNNQVTYIISFLVSDTVVDIKKQQDDLINILVNSSKISYDGLAAINEYVRNCYDFTSASFKNGSDLYINPLTGQVSSTKLNVPYIKISYNGEFKLEYKQ